MFEASDEETISEVEDDFDSETTSETFKIKVESENDAPEAEQDLAYIMDEDGSITFTQEQLLEYASDVDGDELVASNVQSRRRCNRFQIMVTVRSQLYLPLTSMAS
ncbi:cadherin-like domain-containing protein [Vibrio lentus]|nr:cadherin-like domain-containing protein [Vibrio lentus]